MSHKKFGCIIRERVDFLGQILDIYQFIAANNVMMEIDKYRYKELFHQILRISEYERAHKLYFVYVDILEELNIEIFEGLK